MSLLESRPAPKVARAITVGDRVRIERDERRHPSKGTWPQFRGRRGTVVEINVDHRRPHLTEYGIVFGPVTPRTDGRARFRWSGTEPITWFRPYEVRPVMRGGAAELPANRVSAVGRRTAPSRRVQERAA